MTKRRPSPLPEAQRDKIREQVGRRLALARELAGLTDREVTIRLGRKHHTFVVKSEQGTRPVPCEDLVVFAELYRQPVAFFFEPFDKP